MRRVLVVLALLCASVFVGAPQPASARSTTTGFHWNDITSRDGVVLKSNVIAPTSPGRHAGIVFVASWGLNDFQYLAQAKQLAEHGYVVLSYTARGFWFSGGAIDVGGPRDVADASSAIDWLIANTNVDAGRIGIVGLSYGGGISLLAAAKDPRIRAVASMSGWADLAESMAGGRTRRAQSTFFLQAVARIVGRPSAEMTQVLDDYWADRNTEYREQWARARSARHSVDAINRNKPAVLMTHAFGDSVFPANQMVDFYGALTVPKRLELTPGDHATVELPGLAGLANQAWTSLRRWFDQYLRGIDTGIGDEPGVVVRPHGSSAVESYPDWERVSTRTDRAGLGAPTGWTATGTLGGPAAAGWSQTIRAGVDTPATAGIALLTNGLEGLTGIPPTLWLASVSRHDAGVWVSDRYPADTRVRGVPRLHLSVSSSRPAGTVFAYLYDLNAAGLGRLVSHGPISWTAGTTAVDLPMQVTAFDLPAGHRLALVVDTKDPQYLDANSHDSTITFTGHSWLDLPVR
jgi:putative CocE/NonD family hydrolase